MPLGAFKAIVTSTLKALGLIPLALNEQCLTLDGTGDAVSFGDNHDPGTSDFTWECWARKTTATTGVMLNKRPSGGAGANNGVTWPINSSGQSDPFIDDGGGNFIRVTAGSGFNDGFWHHHAFTWETSTGTLRSYADGALIGTSVDSLMIGANFNNATLFRVGSDPVPGNFLNGEVDEVRIWNVKRTLQEIRDNRFRHIAKNTTNLVGYYRFEGDVLDQTSTGANGTLIGDADPTATNPPFRHSDAYSVMLGEIMFDVGTLPTDRLAHWVLDETTGTAAFDEGVGEGNAFEGAYANTPTLEDRALLGLRGFKGALFDRDAANEFVNGVGLTPLGTATAAVWSVVVWFRMSATAIGTSMALYDQRQTAGSNSNAGTGIDSAGSLLMATGSDSPAGLTGSTVLEEERIYCAVFTHEAVSQRRRIYLNGILDASDAGARNYAGGANGMFSIGRRPGTLNDNFMKGNIMDVAVFRNIELTADQAEMIFLVGSAGRYKDVVLDDVPTSYWRLDEPSGTVAADQQGANVGTYVNGPTLNKDTLLPGGGTPDPAVAGAERELGKAITIDGATQRVEANGAGTLFSGVNAVSMSCWVTTTSTTQGIVPLAPGLAAGGNGLFTLQFNQRHTPSPVLDTNAIEITRRSTGGTLEDANFNTGGAHRDGLPHHYVVTYDGSDMRLYFDGIEVASFATTLNIGTMDQFAIGGLLRTTFILGTPGDFDEVAVYPFALSADRVRAQFLAGTATSLYGATVGADGPLGYYRLDEGTGTTAFDEMGALDGTHVGAAPNATKLTDKFVDDGGAAVDFDGVDDRIEFASALIATGDVSNFAIECLVKPDVLQLSYLVNNREPGGDTNMNLQLLATGAFRFDKFPPAAQEFDGVKTLDVGERGHVVYVETGATRELFVDGALDATDGSAETFTGSAMTQAALGISAVGLTQDFDGILDEVAVYAHSLRAPRIEAHFRVGR